MNTKLYGISLAVVLMSAAGTVMALPLGSDITIYDNNSTASSWEGAQEDQETEPGTIHNQAWDLEGMYMQNGSTLTLVGGYDFKNGVNYNGHNYSSGDIFVDVNGDAQYGATISGSGLGNVVSTTTMYGYDYVLDLNYNTMTYNVVQLTAGSSVYKVSDIAGSNPWTYNTGGTAVAGYQDVAFSYYSGLSDADVGGLQGSTHYAIVVDTSFLSAGTATFHYTMSCGNDNLMGRTTLVPDAASTSILLGAALLGLGGIRRKLGV